MTKTLYLCYFGLREPLVQTQVIAYLRQLVAGGIKVYLLTFEPDPRTNWSKEQIEAEKQKLAADGIEWDFLTYHKRPSVPATFFDIVCGAWFAWKAVRHHKIDVLHGRSHVGTMMGALVKKFSARPVKLIFDIRGFLAEEYSDAGIWKENGLLYKTVKSVERRLFRSADAFVVLTEKAREILFPESAETGLDRQGRPVEAIPCCVDLERFALPDENSENEIANGLGLLSLDGRFVISYVGSFGGWYMTSEMADFFKAAREHDSSTFAMILTQSDPEMVRSLLLERGFTEEDLLVKKVTPADIPLYLRPSAFAVSFIKPCYSKLSSSPTKIAEYLASGIPVVSNAGIGDVDELIGSDRVGVLIDEFTGDSYIRALEEINVLRRDKDLADRCRQSAKDRFDLKEIGGVKYKRLYERLFIKH